MIFSQDYYYFFIILQLNHMSHHYIKIKLTSAYNYYTMDKLSRTFYPKASNSRNTTQRDTQIKRLNSHKQKIPSLKQIKKIVINKQQTIQKQQTFLQLLIENEPTAYLSRNLKLKRKNHTERSQQGTGSGNLYNQVNLTNRKIMQGESQRKIINRKHENLEKLESYNKSSNTSKIRPKSRQQIQSSSLPQAINIKNEVTRPQTSKGTRKQSGSQCIPRFQEQNFYIDIIISKNKTPCMGPSTNANRVSDLKAKKPVKGYNLKTSIDDQFLSLFAS